MRFYSFRLLHVLVSVCVCVGGDELGGAGAGERVVRC